MLDTTTLSAILLLASASTLLIAAMLYPSALLRWFQRKRYQYEVTFSLYMLTSTEKFIFSTSFLARQLVSHCYANIFPLNNIIHRPYIRSTPYTLSRTRAMLQPFTNNY